MFKKESSITCGCVGLLYKIQMQMQLRYNIIMSIIRKKAHFYSSEISNRKNAKFYISEIL